jgi:hypothetical protein
MIFPCKKKNLGPNYYVPILIHQAVLLQGEHVKYMDIILLSNTSLGRMEIISSTAFMQAISIHPPLWA